MRFRTCGLPSRSGEARAYAHAGRNAPAIGIRPQAVPFFLLALNHPFWMPQWGRGEALYQALREPDQDHSTIRDELPAYYAQNGRSTYASALLVPLGAFDEAPPSWLIWGAEFKRYRQSAQFRSYIERSGALTYWRAKGFPSRCRAIEGDSFLCD